MFNTIVNVTAKHGGATFSAMQNAGPLRTKDKKRFPNRIREIRVEKGLSQEDVGERAGMSWQNVGKLERGQGRLAVHHMEQLAEALGVKPSDLLPGGYQNTEQENRHLRILQTLTPERRQQIFNLADELLMEQAGAAQKTD